MIGIDQYNWLVYEGVAPDGHGVWPTPVISQAALMSSADDWVRRQLFSLANDAKLVFREDSFDPSTRIRRGRLYAWQDGQSQPQNWKVRPHPVIPDEVAARDHLGRVGKSLLTYHAYSGLASKFVENSQLILALGSPHAMTLWNIVAVERIMMGEDLVTLRARSSLGVLPVLTPERIPAEGRVRVQRSYEKVIDAAYRSGPESIVDRCRDAAQVAIGAWCALESGNVDLATIDLSPLLDRLESNSEFRQSRVLMDAARIIARLHARKPNEQIKRDLRFLSESDAEVALANLGLIFRELRWAA